METRTTQVETAGCVICHGPNPTDAKTCSRDCAEDLALATGRITDYPEAEITMDTSTPIELNPMTEAQRQAYLVVRGQATHPHEHDVQCLACRQAAVNIVDAIAPTIRDEARLAVHEGIVDKFAADPLGEAPNRVSVIEHSRHWANTIRQHLALHRLPTEWAGQLPDGYVEAS
jgi:hypothetical protein